jgi:hypothetical protein
VALEPRRLRPNLEPQGDGALPRGEHAHDLQRGDGVECAVEPAAVGDGVYVPAEEDGLLRVAGGSGPEVSSLVAFDLDAVYLIELALEPVAGLDPLVGPGDPAGAVRAAGEVGELF